MLEFWHIISPYILPLYYFIIFFVVINLLLENRNPLKTHSYLLLLLLLPVIGVLIYFFFGQHQLKRKIFAKRGLINQAFGPIYAKEQLDAKTKVDVKVIKPYRQFEKLIRFLKNDLSPLTPNNKVTILRNGESKFPALMDAIAKAEDHIHIEYYIFENDTIGGPLADLLIEKASQGIEVRMLLDGVGSLALKKGFFKIEEEKIDPISESCKLFLEDYAAIIASFDQLLNSIDDNPDNINLIIARTSQEEELNGYSSDPQMFQCLQNPAFKKQVDILNNKRERLISN